MPEFSINGYIVSTWSKRPDSIFWRFSEISETPLLPKCLVEADTKNDALEIIRNEIKTFSEDKWKIKKILAFGELMHNVHLKNKENPYEFLKAFKKRFSSFKILREHFHEDKESHYLIFYYSCIEQYAKLQTSIDFSKWLEGRKNLTIPQLQIYFANGGVKEYLIEDLLENDLITKTKEFAVITK